jgi:fructose-bisphosphate aldolase, class II
MLIHIKKLFEGDVVGKFAYPAFNTQNLETTLGIVAAAEELNVPVIIATSEGSVKYAGLETIFEIMATVALRSKAPIALHMDHGKDAELLEHAIELGYSSVMIDHSQLPESENVHDTKAMVALAHDEGAWVQGEIGRIRGSEDWVSVSDAESLLTNPEDALKFYQATGVDTLAASVGTIHGIIKIKGDAKPHVDINRIQAIYDKVKIPLVLHGASGVPDEVITQAIQAGVAIINIDTELRLAFSDALKQSIKDQPDEIDPRHLMKPVIEAVKQAAMKKLKAFGTKNLGIRK